MTIKILNPGLLTTIQDLGRWGFQNVGMTVAGAMDHYSLKVANLLVGNKIDEACIEASFLGPEIEFNTDDIISITGADMSPKINGAPVNMWEAVSVKRGDILKFQGAKSGVRTYIAFGRTLDVPVIMGSKSTFLRGKLGGFNGRKLAKGDEIKLGSEMKSKLYALPEKYIPKYSKTQEIRVVLGPQKDYFDDDAINTFLSSEYKITNEADRMGYRLEGEKIKHIETPDIISDGIVFGSIQVPGHGSPIVMMADRQTTGGYTKIATVISQDLEKLAQMGAGGSIRFKEVSVEEAQNLFAARETLYKEIEEKLIIKNLEKNLFELMFLNPKQRYHTVKMGRNTYRVTIEKID